MKSVRIATWRRRPARAPLEQEEYFVMLNNGEPLRGYKLVEA